MMENLFTIFLMAALFVVGLMIGTIHKNVYKSEINEAIAKCEVHRGLVSFTSRKIYCVDGTIILNGE